MNLSAAAVQNILIGAIIMFSIVMVWLLAEFKKVKQEIKERLGVNNDMMKLRLQAYERLTLYAERASLKNLISRTPCNNMNVADLQLTLLETLRAEYEYNVSQQIYVSEDVWKAVGNLKDQNIYIINQIAATLPPQANAIELSKKIVTYTSTTNAELSFIVLSALQHEAKQLLS